MKYLLVLILAFSLSACRKLLPEPDSDVSAAQDVNIAMLAFDDVFKQVDLAADDVQLKKNGPSITLDTVSNSKVMTIDFGDSTLGFDGRVRKGIIEVRWTGKYREIGKSIVITPKNYYVNDNKVEGNKTVTRMGNSLSGSPQFLVNVDNGRIIYPNGKHVTFSANSFREWIQGHQTPLQFQDDIYSVTWSANGNSSDGNGYRMNDRDKLRIDFSCQFRITEGVLEIWPDDKDPRFVNFGNGNCDREITVEINEEVYKIQR